MRNEINCKENEERHQYEIQRMQVQPKPIKQSRRFSNTFSVRLEAKRRASSLLNLSTKTIAEVHATRSESESGSGGLLTVDDLHAFGSNMPPPPSLRMTHLTRINRALDGKHSGFSVSPTKKVSFNQTNSSHDAPRTNLRGALSMSSSFGNGNTRTNTATNSSNGMNSSYYDTAGTSTGGGSDTETSYDAAGFASPSGDAINDSTHDSPEKIKRQAQVCYELY